MKWCGFTARIDRFRGRSGEFDGVAIKLPCKLGGESIAQIRSPTKAVLVLYIGALSGVVFRFVSSAFATWAIMGIILSLSLFDSNSIVLFRVAVATAIKEVVPLMDTSKLEAFVGQVVNDMAASMSGVMVNLGHKLGLYQAMSGAGSLTPLQLAEKTNTHPRYVLEWLNNQAAGGYVTYDAGQGSYELSEEHAMVLANSESPMFLAPGFDVVSSLWLDEEKVIAAFQNGARDWLA